MRELFSFFNWLQGSDIISILFLYVLLMSVIYLYRFFKTKDAARAWYKKKLILGGASMLGVVLLWLFLGFVGSVTGIGQGGRAPIPSIPGSTGSYGSSVVYNNSYYNTTSNGTIEDTREFIKKAFSATLKTRDVEAVAEKVEDLIGDSDGRIDSSNISSKYANFTFVIPKSELSDFKEKLKSFTNEKLYTQTVSSQNLLGQKQALERNQDTTKNQIGTTIVESQRLQTAYQKDSSALKSQLVTYNAQLKATQNAYSSRLNELTIATNTLVIATLTEKIETLEQNQNILRQDIQRVTMELNNLSNTFKANMTSIGASLEEQNKALSSLDSQENVLLNNVETVEGSIQISYVSVWEIIDIYSPINPIIIFFVALFALRMYFLYRKDKEVSKVTM